MSCNGATAEALPSLKVVGVNCTGNEDIAFKYWGDVVVNSPSTSVAASTGVPQIWLSQAKALDLFKGSVHMAVPSTGTQERSHHGLQVRHRLSGDCECRVCY